jgi:hypothetical protein
MADRSDSKLWRTLLNSEDWVGIDRLDRPPSSLSNYLRFHVWNGEAGRISMTVCAPGSNFQFDVSAETSSRFCHLVSATAACERRIKNEDSDCCQNRLNRRSSSSWKYCFWQLSCFLDRDHSRSDGFSRAWKQYLERRRRFRGQSGKGAPFRAMRIQ